MKRLFHGLAMAVKWLIAGIILVEVLSFLVITASNYLIYGQLRDGNPVRYDPYALFLTRGWPRPTVNHAGAAAPGTCQTIWMFGGSTMAGEGEDDAKTIPSLVADLLNRQPPLMPAVIKNFGEPGFNALLETKYLQKALIDSPVAPQVIVFYDGANDCTYFAQHRTPDAHHGYHRLRGLVESYYRSFFGLLKPLNAAWYASYTMELYDKLREGVIHIQPDSPGLQNFAAAAENRYNYLQRLAASMGARFLLFWQPCWWVETAPVADSVRQAEDITVGRHFALKENFLVINRALMQRLKDKPYFVDFQNILCSRTAPVYEKDGIHLFDEGRRLVAARMSQVLKERLSLTAARSGDSR